MIILGKNKVLKDYYIDESGKISNKFGEIAYTYIHKGYEIFRKQAVHKIMMYTFKGFRDGHKWHIHHLDGNKLNNKLDNLVYLTKSEHHILHNIGNQYCLGKHQTIEHRKKLSDSHKGIIPTSESKEKNRQAHLGRIWVNNGIINKHIFPNEIPNGFVRGRL